MARKKTPTKPSVTKATKPEDAEICRRRPPFAVVEQFEGMWKLTSIVSVTDLLFVFGFMLADLWGKGTWNASVTDFLLACWNHCPTFNGDVKWVSDGFVVCLQLHAGGSLREGYMKCVGDGFLVGLLEPLSYLQWRHQMRRWRICCLSAGASLFTFTGRVHQMRQWRIWCLVIIC